MPNIKKIIALTVATILVFSMMLTSCSGAETDSKKSEAKYQKGDKVKYTLSLGSVKNPVVGLHMAVYYNEDELKVKEDSADHVNCSNFIFADGSFENGIVDFNFSDINGVDFSQKSMLLTVEFELEKNVEALSSFTFYIWEFYDDESLYVDGGYISDYKLFESVSVNGKTVVDSAEPKRNMEIKGGDVFK